MKNLLVYVSRCSFLRATSNQSTSVREARAARLFFANQPIRLLFSGVLVDIAKIVFIVCRILSGS